MLKNHHFELFILLIIFYVALGINKNHNKPFGSGLRVAIEPYDGFIDPIAFIEKYVIKNKPILFKNAARNWPATTQWNDNYFLSLNLSEYKKTSVHVEVQKKENRSVKSFDMEFKDFINAYNNSEIYLVDKLPAFLDADLLVPYSLQCLLWDDAVNQVLMWFSSGGTSSVVHTDDMDNINCLITGEKVFVLVDPHVHKDKIPLREEGAYSDIDVDRVDFDKYPGMETVDFQIANMTAGDCIYIPRLWIHQVRSFHRNIAINMWFTKSARELSMLSRSDLEDNCSPEPVIRTFLGKYASIENEPPVGIMDVLKQFVNLDINGLLEKIMQSFGEFDKMILMKSRDHVKSVIKDIFLELDHNNDSVIELVEIDSLSNENISRTISYLEYLKVYLESLMIPIDSVKLVKDQNDHTYRSPHSEL